MARLVFAMMQSLDGYVADSDGGFQSLRPGNVLFQHFNDHLSEVAGMLYGRRMYEIMRYWDEDHADWEAIERDFAEKWRSRPKWVASRTLRSVGPNATLVNGDLEPFVRHLRSRIDGEIDVAGPQLAAYVSGLGCLDEHRLYFQPIVLGGGKPYFAGARPPLRLVSYECVGEEALKLTYVAM